MGRVNKCSTTLFRALIRWFCWVGLITIPAIIIFVVMTYLRVRNSRFRRQRIKPRSSGSKTEE